MQFLGQHFLKNDSAIKKIIAALDIKPGETIIEIGPGKGALTFPLAEECIQKKCHLIAIEKDQELFSTLKEKYKDNENITVIEGDVLKILTDLTDDKKQVVSNYKIVGNIPYYITGKLLRTISELQNKPITSVLMVQKEVAERICATPRLRQGFDGQEGYSGQAKMNLLAAATQYWADPELILRLKASEFDPPPEVDSAVIKLATKTLATSELEADNYYKLIHIIFKQPRKTLANNLRAGLNISREEIEKILSLLKLPLNCRPQDLSVEQIIKLSQINFSSQIN